MRISMLTAALAALPLAALAAETKPEKPLQAAEVEVICDAVWQVQAFANSTMVAKLSPGDAAWNVNAGARRVACVSGAKVRYEAVEDVILINPDEDKAKQLIIRRILVHAYVKPKTQGTKHEMWETLTEPDPQYGLFKAN